MSVPKEVVVTFDTNKQIAQNFHHEGEKIYAPLIKLFSSIENSLPSRYEPFDGKDSKKFSAFSPFWECQKSTTI